MAKQRNTTMADKDDIRELHSKIENVQRYLQDGQSKLQDSIAALSNEVTRLVAIVASFPHPQARPCSFFLEHMEEHKVSKSPTTLRTEFDAHVVQHKTIEAKLDSLTKFMYISIGALIIIQIVFDIAVKMVSK